MDMSKGVDEKTVTMEVQDLPVMDLSRLQAHMDRLDATITTAEMGLGRTKGMVLSRESEMIIVRTAHPRLQLLILFAIARAKPHLQMYIAQLVGAIEAVQSLSSRRAMFTEFVEMTKLWHGAYLLCTCGLTQKTIKNTKETGISNFDFTSLVELEYPNLPVEVSDTKPKIIMHSASRNSTAFLINKVEEDILNSKDAPFIGPRHVVGKIMTSGAVPVLMKKPVSTKVRFAEDRKSVSICSAQLGRRLKDMDEVLKVEGVDTKLMGTLRTYFAYLYERRSYCMLSYEEALAMGYSDPTASKSLRNIVYEGAF